MERNFSCPSNLSFLQIEDVFINKDEGKCENYTSLYITEDTVIGVYNILKKVKVRNCV